MLGGESSGRVSHGLDAHGHDLPYDELILAQCVPAGRQVGVARGRPQRALQRWGHAPHALGSRGGYALHFPAWRARLPRSGPDRPGAIGAIATGTPGAIRSPAREGPMTTALELVGAFLPAATLLTAAMFLVAFQLGRLIQWLDGPPFRCA